MPGTRISSASRISSAFATSSVRASMPAWRTRIFSTSAAQPNATRASSPTLALMRTDGIVVIVDAIGVPAADLRELTLGVKAAPR